MYFVVEGNFTNSALAILQSTIAQAVFEPRRITCTDWERAQRARDRERALGWEQNSFWVGQVSMAKPETIIVPALIVYHCKNGGLV